MINQLYQGRLQIRYVHIYIKVIWNNVLCLRGIEFGSYTSLSLYITIVPKAYWFVTGATNNMSPKTQGSVFLNTIIHKSFLLDFVNILRHCTMR